jgi:hypothetical protein
MLEIPENPILDHIAEVASEADEPITRNQVAAVLTAYKNILEGDPLGTMLQDPETGAMAWRILDQTTGLHMWRVNTPDGGMYNDLQPTLAGWKPVKVVEQ